MENASATSWDSIFGPEAISSRPLGEMKPPYGATTTRVTTGRSSTFAGGFRPEFVNGAAEHLKKLRKG